MSTAARITAGIFLLVVLVGSAFMLWALSTQTTARNDFRSRLVSVQSSVSEVNWACPESGVDPRCLASLSVTQALGFSEDDMIHSGLPFDSIITILLLRTFDDLPEITHSFAFPSDAAACVEPLKRATEAVIDSPGGIEQTRAFEEAMTECQTALDDASYWPMSIRRDDAASISDPSALPSP